VIFEPLPYWKLTNRHSDHQNSDLRDTPSDDDSSFVQMILQRSAQDHKADNVYEYADVAGPDTEILERSKMMRGLQSVPQSGFSPENALVPLDLLVHDPIVQVVSKEKTEEDCDLHMEVGLGLEALGFSGKATDYGCSIDPRYDRWSESESKGRWAFQKHGVGDLGEECHWLPSESYLCVRDISAP
jgi:hypothetical protein